MKSKKHFFAILLSILFFMTTMISDSIPCQAASRLQPTDEIVTVVIDPGHGGDNKGTQSGNTMEKIMTMITAKAMYEELSKFENVNVYMTHTEDMDYSLKERAEFAESVHADFLYSIHYNASENHTMYGTEVWVSCKAPYNAYGYQFSYPHLQTLSEKGLFVRGIKSRRDDKSKEDYYGIIRESVALGVPAVIIEHCYVDEERDADYIKNEEDYKAFGRMDALSVAKYFGLKSQALGLDYSQNPVELPQVSSDTIVPGTLLDKTAPEICTIEISECDYESGKITLTVSAADYDSPLIYYDYSLDNGQSYSRLETWPGSNTLTGTYTDTFHLNLSIPDATRPNIIVRAYNIADLYKKSNTLSFDRTFRNQEESGEITAPYRDLYTEDNPTDSMSESSAEATASEQASEAVATQPIEHERPSVGTTTFLPTVAEIEEDSSVGILTFLKFCLALVIVLFFIVLTTQIVNYQRRQKRRKR